MHSLALLCNLHADGPTSLHRLREAGVEDLDGVRSSQHSALSNWLGMALPAASRFRKEAELLAERVGAGLLEEEDGVVPSQPLSCLRPVVSDVPVVRTPPEREVLPEVLPEVLNGSPSRSAPRPMPPPLAARNGQRAHVARELKPGPRPKPGLAIDCADLDWLTPERRAGLRESGLETLGDLVGMDVMDLARALGETFSGARRLQFLASRVPAVAPDTVTAPLPSRALARRERTAGEASQAEPGPGAAGPFA